MPGTASFCVKVSTIVDHKEIGIMTDTTVFQEELLNFFENVEKDFDELLKPTLTHSPENREVEDDSCR